MTDRIAIMYAGKIIEDGGSRKCIVELAIPIRAV